MRVGDLALDRPGEDDMADRDMTMIEWHAGDGVWITDGEYCGHAGVVGDGPARDDGLVVVEISTERGVIIGSVPKDELEPYSWFPASDRERVAGVIEKLYPRGRRRTVDALELANFLMMHGLRFPSDPPDEVPGHVEEFVLTWHPVSGGPPHEIPLRTPWVFGAQACGEFDVSTRQWPDDHRDPATVA